MDEAELHIGDVFRVGAALVQLSQPRQPCFKLGVRFRDPEVMGRFIGAMQPGVYVRVLEEGRVGVGAELAAEVLKPENPTVRDVFHLLYNAREDPAATRKAIDTPELAESCRKDLMNNAVEDPPLSANDSGLL